MSFRLFGINVEVQLSFWITTVLFGYYNHANDPDVPLVAAVAVWVVVVFLSILAHELGHAFAMKRHGIQPDIALYGLGGLTFNRSNVPLRRRDQVIISLAGPFAGFALAGLMFAAMRFLPRLFVGLPPVGVYAVDCVLFVNVVWGIVNLVPVLPLDGGHVLEQTLGPRHVQLTAAISTLVGFLLAAVFLYEKWLFAALMFGYLAFQSYRRFAAEGETSSRWEGRDPAPRPGAKREGGRWPFARGAPPSDAVPPELEALLRTADHALAEEALERAAAVAQQVLEAAGDTSRPARRRALEVIAWTHLLAGRPDVAAEVLVEARRAGPVDAAVEGAVLFAQRDFARARKVLEAARAQGDDRKQIVGPLVQILLELGEVARAADVALEVVDTLSDDDARRMASLAFTHGSFASAARLHEAIFDRRREPEDAYEAARAEARGGRPDQAIELLRRAVDAGFSDRARAWSDAALATLRGDHEEPGGDGGHPHTPGLETVLPRP